MAEIEEQCKLSMIYIDCLQFCDSNLGSTTHSEELAIFLACPLLILPLINAWASLPFTGSSMTGYPSFIGTAARKPDNAAKFLIDFSGVVLDAMSTERSVLLKAPDEGRYVPSRFFLI